MDTDFHVLIPAYRPDEKELIGLIEALRGDFPLIIIDDGSGGAYGAIFARAESLGATVLRHGCNRGKGAALKTGLAYLKEHAPHGGVVTADADGQHAAKDIVRIASALREHPEALVLGVRDLSRMPLRSRIGNTITRFAFTFATGVRISDTQTGLRGVPGSLYDFLLGVSGARYEFELNALIDLCGAGKPPFEVPIDTIYIEGNKSSHFHALRDGIRVFSRLLKYCASSLGCALVDFSLYALLLLWLPVEWSYVAARSVSIALNYQLNRRVVFHRGPSMKSAVEYVLLALGVMLVGSLAVRLLAGAGVGKVLSKLMVDMALWVANYIVQRRWIFRRR